MSESDLERSFPWIDWTEPVLVSTFQGAHGFGCRYCIGMFGLKGREVKDLPKTEEEFNQHLSSKHGKLRRSQTN